MDDGRVKNIQNPHRNKPSIREPSVITGWWKHTQNDPQYFCVYQQQQPKKDLKISGAQIKIGTFRFANNVFYNVDSI